MSRKINHRQITFAREYRELSIVELAKKIKGLSLSRLIRIEAGLEIINDEELEKIANVLNFPILFFECYIYNRSISNHYRK